MSLALRKLVVQRGETLALSGLSLDIPSGAKVLVLGPNGAGKTTLLRVVAGLIPPKSGEIHVDGKIGWCSQHECLWPDLTPAEHLELFAELLGAVPQARSRLKAVDLETKSDALVHTLSGGMRRRLSLALALLNNPEILLLDEPDAGLDADGQAKLANLLSAAAKDRTVLITTHHPDNLEDVATHVLMLRQGELKCFCGKTEIFESVPEHFRITCTFETGADSWTTANPQSDLSALLKSLESSGRTAKSIHSERRPLSELVEALPAPQLPEDSPTARTQRPVPSDPENVGLLRASRTLTKVALKRLVRDPLSQVLTVATPALFALFFWAALSPEEFTQVAPRLGVFAGLMLVFATTVYVARDLESGVLERLYLARVPRTSYVFSAVATQLIPGVLSIALLFAIAHLLGLDTQVEPASHLVLVLNAAACASVGVLCASLAKSVPQAMVIASTSMFLLMLFSGIVFPMPDYQILDMLIPRHAVRALDSNAAHHLFWSAALFVAYTFGAWATLGSKWKTKVNS